MALAGLLLLLQVANAFDTDRAVFSPKWFYIFGKVISGLVPAGICFMYFYQIYFHIRFYKMKLSTLVGLIPTYYLIENQ